VMVAYCHRDTRAGQIMSNEEVHRMGESLNVEYQRLAKQPIGPDHG
jgi:hypothetical protein